MSENGLFNLMIVQYISGWKRRSIYGHQAIMCHRSALFSSSVLDWHLSSFIWSCQHWVYSTLRLSKQKCEGLNPKGFCKITFALVLLLIHTQYSKIHLKCCSIIKAYDISLYFRSLVNKQPLQKTVKP